MNTEWISLIFSVAGGEVPEPKDLVVDITEGEVVVHWDKPVGAPSDTQYNVQILKYVYLQYITALFTDFLLI